MILSKEEILNSRVAFLGVTLIPKISGVYFLIKDNVVIYVGQTINIKTRIGSHKSLREKDFDSYYFIPVIDGDKKKELESFYIITLRPVHNKYNRYIYFSKDCEETKEAYLLYRQGKKITYELSSW